MNENQNLDQQILELFHRFNDVGKAAVLIVMYRLLDIDDPTKEGLERLYPGVNYDKAVQIAEEWMKQKPFAF